MDKKTLKIILDLLDEHYGKEYICYLQYEKPYELLIATMLSAQCTDDRVNMVTKNLFEKYPTLEDFSKAEQSEMEKDIHSTGFFRNKAKNIISATNQLVMIYNGKLPSDLPSLTGLAGVGRKTANVVRGHIFDIESIVVDTHVKRISNKLGFTTKSDPDKIEQDLMELLPREHWLRYNTQIIAHGRTICPARNPKCYSCFLLPYCKAGLESRLEKLR